MKRKDGIIPLVLGFALTLGITGCGAPSDSSTSAGPSDGRPGVEVSTESGRGSYRNITAAELAAMLENKDFLLINTHVPYEGEIEGTDLFLDYQRAEELVGELPADKHSKIVVYCRTDRMSTIAVEVWADAGYTDLYHLVGGFVDWESRGYPLVRLDR